MGFCPAYRGEGISWTSSSLAHADPSTSKALDADVMHGPAGARIER
jgi:hypothetical protein